VEQKTNLIVVYKIGKRQNVKKCSRVSRVPGSNTLHVLGQLALAVQRLSPLRLIDHLPHVHFNFSLVLRDTVEPVYDRGQLLSCDV
jgi:hypothetical protein